MTTDKALGLLINGKEGFLNRHFWFNFHL